MDQPVWKGPQTTVGEGDAAQQRQIPNLASIDLNRLVELEALLQCRNITHAAQHVGRSQPAMSRALSRLRGMFNDDLLVRGSSGLVLTPQADRLAKRLPSLLNAIREMVNSRSFDPRDMRCKITMAMPDHQGLVLLPGLLRRLQECAPHLHIVTDPVLDGALRRLEQGEIDLAMGQIGAAPAGYLRRTLYTDRCTCLLRHDHPALEREWSIGTFAALRHASIGSNANDRFGQIYDGLAQLGLPDRNPLVVSNLLTAAVVVAATDLALIVPHRVATRIAAMLPLAIVDPPVEVTPYEVVLIWHERCHRDVEHRWLRREIAVAARIDGADLSDECGIPFDDPH
ncbi:LysR family transcriptional regulator [Sinorhizobium sp. 7-81]|uniref:LysR family transcriptional regulator n=1 Tax=Sinorhizobium sp. 8-89 TaxID=3049089 RepID=UPI0024C2CDD7|nr:LysR family transcriptional regulator [Sinorhizobium sp. 8-89]MDK1493546.1 LysR family transcriptional regulator [Sinorhizobium sp. 8-89]